MLTTLDGITFDDVLLVPQFSELASRSEADISTKIGSIELKIPIISSNMDTITDFHMARAMAQNGCLGILHRYSHASFVAEDLQQLMNEKHVPVPSIGVMSQDYEKAESYREFTNSICVDVAHGDSVLVCAMVSNLVKLGYKNIVAGNVVTAAGTKRLIQAGANIIKVGVGPGSVCTTRIVTGHGFPQLTAIELCASAAKEAGAYIIADGGIRSSGDIVKALAAGADAVMLGGMFAGYDETPSAQMKVYRGMASVDAQMEFRGRVGNNTAEGITIDIENKGPVKNLIDELSGGIRSGLSYSGCRTIEELQKNAIFIRITSNGLIESHPHGKSK